jgi:glycosyltransferase involved in cell wall biosynthesis
MPWLGDGLRISADIRASCALSSLMQRWRPQIVHTHLTKAGAIGRAVASRERVPVVVHTFHGHVADERDSPLQSAAFVHLERRLAARSDALVAVAPSMRDERLALGIGSPGQWHVLPTGFDVGFLLSDRIPRDRARATLGLPVEGPAIGVIGRMVESNDHRTLFGAAARVLTERPDAIVVVAGAGELRSRVEREARSALGDRVHFLGWVQDLPALYGAVDVVALTSRLESRPAALIEAAAWGTPTVATAVGGVQDVVRDGATGLLVPPQDPVALATQLLTLLDDPEGARRMGEEGARWVRHRFSEARLADDLTELYRELLARKSPRAGLRGTSRTPALAG